MKTFTERAKEITTIPHVLAMVERLEEECDNILVGNNYLDKPTTELDNLINRPNRPGSPERIAHYKKAVELWEAKGKPENYPSIAESIK